MDNLDLAGQHIKGYELQERIAAGGFGAVYRAYQSTVGREVAIKVILPGFANKPDFIRRFEAEAQLIARLEHPFIVPLHDYWRDPDGAYLVMRYLRSGSLHDYLRKNGALSIEETLNLFSQIAQGLHVAHRNQVIHRDIKPGNILLDEDGNGYLADFGIAKDHATTQNITAPDSFIGSPEYLAPEQARSEAVTPQTDIYSLGVVLYEMLTGEHPFSSAEKITYIFKHLNEPLPDVMTLDDSIQDDVNQVIQKATAKDPKARFKDVIEMMQALRQAAQLDVTPTPTSLVELLTPREQEVMQLIIDGKSNREIADVLVLTEGTVKQYINNIYRKLKVRSRVQAITRARDLNFVIQKPEVAASVSTGHLPEPDNPYKGLRAFQAADAQDFFGREKLTQKLLTRLQENVDYQRFLAVVGPSGSGKSSVVKAGLMPGLWRGDLPGSENWYIVDMLPGANPIDELEVALIQIATDKSINLHEQLERDKRGLIRAADVILPDDGSELLLVIDQFEEVFTLLEHEDERIHFLSLLREAVMDKRSRVRIVITLRADYYDRPLQYPDFGDLIRNRVETVLPLSAEELERAISEPSCQVGVIFEDGLISCMVSDVHYQPGALPLLQYALTELFERRNGRILTLEAYEAIGGTGGALAKRADEIYLEANNKGQELVRQLFLRLVTLGEGAEDTRRRVVRSDLLAITANTELMDELIDLYAVSRLLSLDNDPSTRRPTVEVAHEAILREWDRLRGWLNESREDIRQQRLIAQAAESWRENDQDDSYLLTGVRLEQAKMWQQQTELAMMPLESDYIQTSIQEAKAQQLAEAERQAREAAQEKRSRTLLRILVAVFAVAAILSGGLTIWANSQRQEAIQQRQLAVSRELAAASVSNLDIDPELSVLLALEALSDVQPLEAVNALHRALPSLHILQVLKGHSGLVHDIAYNHDGTRLASVSWDGTVVIWDVAAGEPLLTLGGHGGNFLFGVAFSPDGERIVTGGGDGLARVWDTRTGEELLVLKGHTPTQVRWLSGVITTAFSPQGTWIATGGADGMVIIWDAVTGNVAQMLYGDEGVLDIAFSPDGTRLASSAIAGTIAVWEVDTGQELLEWTWSDGGMIPGLDFSPDGEHLATAHDDGIARIWDATSGELTLLLTGHQSHVYGITFAPNGTRLATVSYDGTAKIWDAETGQELFTLAGHNGNLQQAAFSPDGTTLATSSIDTTVRIWSTQSGKEVLNVIEAESNHNAFYNRDGSRIITGGIGSTYVWDSSTGEWLSTLAPNCGGSSNIDINEDNDLYINHDRTLVAFL